MDRLELLRQRKTEAAQTEFIRARRVFFHAARQVDVLRQQREAAERDGNASLRQTIDRLTSRAVAMEDIAALHEDSARLAARLAAQEAEIGRANAECERLRQLALERQAQFHQTRKMSEKLGLLASRLRSDEKSLQTRLHESRSDSAVKDEKTGRWIHLQTDL